jgi:type IV pilus assembly protein PilM
VSYDEAERIKVGEPLGTESKEVVPQEVEDAMRSVTNTVVGEIARSLDFFAATATETRIQRVLLTGGSSRVSGMDAVFRERTGLEVEHMNPLAKMLPSTRFDPDYLNQIGPSLSVGIGLALRKVDES